MKGRMNKLFIAGVLFLVVATVWVVADEIIQILEEADQIPPNSCVETDGGLNFTVAGCINGTFNTSAGLLENVTFCDGCVDNRTLIEYACGQNILPELNASAYAVLVNCTNGCSKGRCL